MKKMSLRTRLFMIMMSTLLLSVISIGTLICLISYRNIVDLSVQTCNQLVDKTTNEINSLLSNMVSMPAVIGRDPRIQNYMRMTFSAKDDFNVEYEISAFLSEMNQYDKNIFCIYFFSENGISTESKYYRLTLEDLSSNPMYQEACQKGTTIWRTPQSGSSVSVTTSERLITAITPVKDIGSGDYSGVVVIELTEKLLIDRLNVGIGKHGFLFICDENGTPIICPNGTDVETLQDQYLSEDSSETKSKNLMIHRQLDNCKWSVIGVVPHEDLIANVRSVVQTTIFTCLLLLIIFSCVIKNLSDYILTPIDQLNEKMGQVAAGNLSARAEISRNDELGTLTLHFNEMVEQLGNLLHQEAESQKQLRLAEFKALQAQIKPHFLYNTLDSIIWMARIRDHDGVVQMVFALTNFLKICLSGGKEIISLEQEFQHTSSYLAIQEVRYKGKFSHSISLADEVRDCMIPKLIVQPLVENAIYHGMKLKHDPCHLIVRAEERGGRVVIDVIDDGVGMTDATASMLRDTLHSTNSSGHGIANVNERIRIMCGPDFGLSFESVYGEGTAFHISLPKNKEKNS